MIGWSSRNLLKEWTSLTKEEKDLELRKLRVKDFWYMCGMAVTAVLIAGVFGASAVWDEWFSAHPRIFLVLDLVTFPGILIVTSFIAIHKTKQVK